MFSPFGVRHVMIRTYLSILRNCQKSTMAKIIPVDLGDSKSQADMAQSVMSGAKSLLAGHVVAVPTDTIYGVAGLAQNSNAVTEIYNIKQRNLEKPIAISVGDIQDIYRWSKVTVSDEVLQDLLPGPVTVVMQRTKELNPELNPNTELVGVRIPDHDFIRALCRTCDGPIALTSANSSGSQSTLSVEEFQSLWPRLDLIFDGGRLGDTEESRLGSTVVDLSVEGKFRIIREGSAYQATVDLLRNKHKLEEILKIL
ncbi:threonylcarbamoyl-AMP synthase-like isoform X1 [Haliotis asinina]|uniref:threonylcarbamoyl-AMP synthase-like isoform X1 n=1 Tax=Haliotis asinina TaxID=109174 RepID=UPI0035320EDF